MHFITNLLTVIRFPGIVYHLFVQSMMCTKKKEENFNETKCIKMNSTMTWNHRNKNEKDTCVKQFRGYRYGVSVCVCQLENSIKMKCLNNVNMTTYHCQYV